MASVPFKSVSTPTVVRGGATTAVSYQLSAAGKASLSVQKAPASAQNSSGQAPKK